MPKKIPKSVTEKAEAIERLKEWVKPKDTIYTILRHCSKSGMSRVIDLKVVDTKHNDISHIGYNVALALGQRYDRSKNGIRISGCGMDMGFELVYRLGEVMYNDGYTFHQRWL